MKFFLVSGDKTKCWVCKTVYKTSERGDHLKYVNWTKEEKKKNQRRKESVRLVTFILREILEELDNTKNHAI